jgi:hypothetical protein
LIDQEDEAAGLASAPEGLAVPPAGLASPPGLAASDGDASGDDAFRCLLQAVAAKNIEMKARIRTLRIPPPCIALGHARNSGHSHITSANRSTQVSFESLISYWPLVSNDFNGLSSSYSYT